MTTTARALPSGWLTTCRRDSIVRVAVTNTTPAGLTPWLQGISAGTLEPSSSRVQQSAPFNNAR